MYSQCSLSVIYILKNKLAYYSPKATVKVLPPSTAPITLTGNTSVVVSNAKLAPLQPLNGVSGVGVSPLPSQMLTPQPYPHKKVFSPLGNLPDFTSIAHIGVSGLLIFAQLYQTMKEFTTIRKSILPELIDKQKTVK